MSEMKPRDQMPQSVEELIAVVGEMVELKKKFDAGDFGVKNLADALWDKLAQLETKHAAIPKA